MGDRVEAWVQVLILLGIGGLAGAVSFVHVHDWTTAHGQLSWVGWTNAVVTELIQIAGGLEVRRRKRTAARTGFVVGVLIAAVGVSLTAQVSQAEPTVSGWIVAALPAIGFLVVVKIVMARTAVTAVTAEVAPVTAQVTAVPPVSIGRHAAGPDRGPGHDQRTDLRPDLTDRPDLTVTAPVVTPRSDPGPTPVTPEVRTAPDPTPDPAPEPGEVRDPVTVTARTPTPTDPFDPDLVALGRTVLTDLTDRGEPVNRGTFAMGVRASGQPIATNTAGALLRRLKEEAVA